MDFPSLPGIKDFLAPPQGSQADITPPRGMRVDFALPWGVEAHFAPPRRHAAGLWHAPHLGSVCCLNTGHVREFSLLIGHVQGLCYTIGHSSGVYFRHNACRCTFSSTRREGKLWPTTGHAHRHCPASGHATPVCPTAGHAGRLCPTTRHALGLGRTIGHKLEFTTTGCACVLCLLEVEVATFYPATSHAGGLCPPTGDLGGLCPTTTHASVLSPTTALVPPPGMLADFAPQ